MTPLDLVVFFVVFFDLFLFLYLTSSPPISAGAGVVRTGGEDGGFSVFSSTGSINDSSAAGIIF